MKVTYKYGAKVIGYRSSDVYASYNGQIGIMTADFGGYTEVTYPHGVAYYLYDQLKYAKNQIVQDIINDL